MKFPFRTHGIVILPEHLHVFWELPAQDSNFSTRWRLIKTDFTRRLLAIGIRIPKNNRGECFLWQRRFWEHLLRDEEDFEKHINYIHYNPVKHKLARHPTDWPYSSLHQYIKKGILPSRWSEAITSDLLSHESFGEMW